jgi:hypothetical protein
MITNNSVFDLTEDIKRDAKVKEDEYKGYRLISNVAHLGIGGKPWIMTILDQDGKTLESFLNDAYCLVFEEAKNYIDSLISGR